MIRKLSFDDLEEQKDSDAIAKESDSNYLSDEEAEEVVEKATKEIELLLKITETYFDTLISSTIGQQLILLDEGKEFVSMMMYYLDSMLPNLLVGDFESIIENVHTDEPDRMYESLVNTREELMTRLVKEYLDK